MQRFALSTLTLVLATLAFAPLASARQTSLHNLSADFNGDGVVTIGELVDYNRAQRQS